MISCGKIILKIFWIILSLVIAPTIAENQIQNDNNENYTYLVRAGYRLESHKFSKYIVSLRFGRPRKFFGDNHGCSGSLLSSTAIVTAAHCVTYPETNEKISLRYIRLEIVAGTIFRLEPRPTMRKSKVKKILVHPNYNYKTVKSDIAILYLYDSIPLDNEHRKKVKLINKRPEVGSICVAFGWGELYFHGPKSNELVYVNLTVLDDIYCMGDSNVLCLGDLTNLEKGLGRGDSGGPLICEGMLAGVVSYGLMPNSLRKSSTTFINPTFFTSIYDNRDWLKKNEAFNLKFSFYYFSIMMLIQSLGINAINF